eukprot:CAMPEP_0194488590 /NCGR_PEP_ID=MMETSP0253-20130528/8460_1 /TAXON_ID=2966 /ORGANISM="Noctiluca scintillans" /LENGTH=110 /DNA_ID=CAMNT_0039328979 /DNA_START=59 /DNA_END=391 /DNA_ORIENTATION=-
MDMFAFLSLLVTIVVVAGDCDPGNIDTCSASEREQIKRWASMTLPERGTIINKKVRKLESLTEGFQEWSSEFGRRWEALPKGKTPSENMKKRAREDLAFMKGVLAKRQRE